MYHPAPGKCAQRAGVDSPPNNLDKNAFMMMCEPAERLRRQPLTGAGIYAIYYVGAFALYREIAERNCNDWFQVPIYIGKAVPPGARKGSVVTNTPGRVLHNRLVDHTRSLQQVPSLDIADFYCRHLIVDEEWIRWGEAMLIDRFKPVWILNGRVERP